MRLEVTSESGRFTLSTVPGSSIRIVFPNDACTVQYAFRLSTQDRAPLHGTAQWEIHHFQHSKRIHACTTLHIGYVNHVILDCKQRSQILCLFRRESFVAHAYFFHFIVQSSVWDLPAELTSRMRRLMRNLIKMNVTSNMSPAAAAILPTAAPVRPIRPGLPGSSLGLFSGGTTGVPVLNFGSTVMLRSADVSPLPGIEMRNGSQSYALLACAELVRETRYRPSGRF